MAYQMQGTACPRCGGTAEVLTVRELFGTPGAAGDGFQRSGQPAGDPQFGQPAGRPQFGQPAGQPQFGQPAGQPQSGQPAAAPAFGQPASQPQFGQPAGQQPGQPGDEQQAGPSSFGPNPHAYGGSVPPGPQQAGGAAPDPADGQGQGQGQGRRWGRGRSGADDYERAAPEGSRGRNRGWRDIDLNGNIVDELGDAVAGAALGFAGRAIGRRVMKALEDRVIPAVQARVAQAQQQAGQQGGELDAIASRYPQLRGCTRDQVIFLDGGTRTVQFSELTMPLTLAQADAVVARLR